jgi:activator of HSP90 ATPase
MSKHVTIRIEQVFAGVAPDRMYAAWLDSDEHTALSGSEASVDPVVGGRYTSWDGYIEGQNLVLEHGRRIVQSWRASDFPDGAPDSRLEVRFEAEKGGTRFVLLHSEVPRDQRDDFEQGWRDYYLEPMQVYFAAARKPAAKKPVAKKKAR